MDEIMTMIVDETSPSLLKGGGYADARPWLEMRDDGSVVEILIATMPGWAQLVELDTRTGEVSAI